MHSRLSIFLTKSKALYKKQFGFRHNTTLPQLMHLETTEKIKQACDAENYTCRDFLDLQKVFDTVNYTILLKKTNPLRA